MLQKFDHEAARAAVLYVAQRVAEPTFHKIGKVFYFADRQHLETYGRLMFGESYTAFEFGPLPLSVYEELKAVREQRLSPEEVGYHIAMQMVRGSPRPAPVVQPMQAPDLDELSVAMIRSLDASIERYGTKTFDELVTLSHDDAWSKAWSSRVNDAPPMPLETLVAASDHATLLLEYLRDPIPGAEEQGPTSGDADGASPV